MWVYLNDLLIRAEDAMVPVSDRGFLYGDSVFETMAAYSGTVFRLRAHVRRFANGAAELGIPLVHDFDAIQDRLDAVMDKNALGDALLRMTLTRGSGPRGLATSACCSPTLLIQCFPAPPRPTELLRRGAALLVSRIRRTPGDAMPSAVKTGNYLNNILAYREAEAAGADEALLLNFLTNVVEGTISNIFFVRSDALYTPSLACGAMPGITRAAVLELAATLGITCHEQPLAVDGLASFEEAFCTNTGWGIMPVHAAGPALYDVPGPMTSRLAAALGDLIAQEAGPAWNAGPISLFLKTSVETISN